jgi:hypothetical protein
MAEKVLINLATGPEDGERVTTRLAGATPMWEWLGDGGTVFSY